MIIKKLVDIEKLSGGKSLDKKYYDIKIEGVSTDTRSVEKNNLFVPLVGENFDGHNFLDQARKMGAVACLWQENLPTPNIDFPFILVENTLTGLQTLAKNYRESLDKIKIIAITGSNGKTSTKDIMDGILSTEYRTKKTMGNFNNHIGLPLTLLSFDENTEIGIVEMGTDGFGQIQSLTKIASPDLAIITNIGPSHLDLLKTKDNVAHAKFEILDGLKEDGVFIYNNDDEILNKIIVEYKIKQNILTLGQNNKASFRVELEKESIDGITFSLYEKDWVGEFHLPIIGRHNIYNAGISIVIARQLGLDHDQIQKGLYKIDKTGMRNELIQKENFTILNDAYKSNPNSLLAALDTLYGIDGFSHKAVVLGNMLDLGDDIVKLHSHIGPKIDPDR